MNRGSQIIMALTIVLGLFSCQNNGEIDSPEFNLELVKWESSTKANLRGLYLVNDTIAWASGAGGTFLKTIDGQTWISDTITGYTHLDFRDVHGFDANNALLMAAGEEGRILRTEDGGITWTEVYTRLDSGIFLDGMDFFGMTGYCYGDPIDGKFVVIRSKDHGRTWTEISPEDLPSALPGEAGFAASGTGIVVNENGVWFGTGGDSVSRIFGLRYEQYEWSTNEMSIRSGEGCGIFSLTNTEPNDLLAVGGCYMDSTNSASNIGSLYFTEYEIDGNKDIVISADFVTDKPPRGYRSCIAFSDFSKLLVTCGRTGVEYSLDGGLSWDPVTDDGYYACALGNTTGWAVGKRGKMTKLRW